MMGDQNVPHSRRGCVSCLQDDLDNASELVESLTKQRDDLQNQLTAARNALLREGMQRDDLLAALEAMRSVCFDRRKANEEFERLGDLYYLEFGRLRPGKDDPMRDSCDEENTAQYNEWSRKRTEAAFDLADNAIAAAKGCA